MFGLLLSPAGGCAWHGIGLFISSSSSIRWENEFKFFDLLKKSMENISTISTLQEGISVQNMPNLDNWLLQNAMMTSTMEELGLSANVDPAETAMLDVISIDDLLNTAEVITQKETADIDRLNSFFAPTKDSLRSALLAWAAKGFPPVEKIASLLLDPPDICSDGQQRTLPYYIEYILNDTITNKLNGLNAKTQGMNFTISWVDRSISLYVTRT